MDVIFVHGWSAKSASMKKVAEALKSPAAKRAGMPAFKPYFLDYRSREDQATLADFAEGLNEQLKDAKLLADPPQRSLCFVTHSTGALVVRQWMLQYDWAKASERVATICFLAPANFGSPLAHKGRSFLGRLAMGRKEFADFSEVGVPTLNALELASPAQWRLAEFDLFSSRGTLYTPKGVRASVITGTHGFRGISSIVNEDGTDGTIVVSGAGLNSRMYAVDLTGGENDAGFVTGGKFCPEVPLLLLDDRDHSSILDPADGDGDLLTGIIRALTVDAAGYKTLKADFEQQSQDAQHTPYQQFVFRLRDDRWDPITDYYVDFAVWQKDKLDTSKTPWVIPKNDRGEPGVRVNAQERQLSRKVRDLFGANVHVNGTDPSLRRFLVPPRELLAAVPSGYVLTIAVHVETGDKDICYNANDLGHIAVFDVDDQGKITWFYEDTTTLVDMRFDRYTRNIVSMSAG